MPPRAMVSALGAGALLMCLNGCAAMRDAAALAESVFEPTVPGAKPVTAEQAAALSDEQIERRLAFVSQRLDDNRTHAALWYYGFLVVNAGGMVVGAALAPSDEGNDQVFDIIEASKGLIGVAYLLGDPLPGRCGADPVRELPSATHAERASQLAEAESILYHAAGRAHQRTGWILHAGNIVLNGAGAAVLLAKESYGNAALSFFLDAGIGEVQILSTPWRPATDWREYEQFVSRGGVPAEPQVRWHIRPNGRGLALQVDF